MIMNILSLFDGMSCGRIALERANIKVDKYYASEIDKYAQIVSNKNYPDIIQLGDVNNWREWNIEQPIDMIMGGSPCQGFSFSGKQLNFNDERSKLFFTFADILRHYKPKYFLLENVVMKKEYENVINNILGEIYPDCGKQDLFGTSTIQPIQICSSLVSAQKRRRLYWTNIPGVAQPNDKHILLKDIMLKDDERNDFKIPTPKRMEYIQRKIEKGWIKKGFNTAETSKSECLMATMYKNLQEFVFKDGDGYRFFHINEFERLQTVPDDYTAEVSETQRLKMLGNGWTVDVICHILKNIKNNKE